MKKESWSREPHAESVARSPFSSRALVLGWQYIIRPTKALRKKPWLNCLEPAIHYVPAMLPIPMRYHNSLPKQ